MNNMEFLPNPGLPDPLYRLLTHSDYTRGESKYSATDLLRSPQQLQLAKRYNDQIIKDPRENIYSVLGSAVHATLESIGAKNPLDGQTIERRLYTTVEDIDISGQIDLHCTLDDGGILTDYKNCKVDILKYDTKIEWEQQLNIYAHLLRQHGIEVSEARVIAIFRNWSLSGFNGLYKVVMSSDAKTITAKKNKNYPEWGCEAIPITLWPDKRVAQFISDRVAIHEAAEEMADDELPPCTNDERWSRTKWLVRERGVVKHQSSHDTKEEAEEKLRELAGDYVITPKLGIPYRCSFYCESRPWCQQIVREGLEFKFEV